MPAYLQKYGALTLDHGYAICFIRPGEKRPFGKDWEAKVHGPKMLARALANGREEFGVGIKTAKTPLVDIDCYDRKLVKHMRDFTADLVGETLERVGLPPKLGMVYRSSKPFPKTQSRVFLDDEGRPVKLEVLGDGQQFVAFHIHPDTKEPYRWKDKQHPANFSHDDLPEITREQALEIVGEFEKQARARGWPEKATVKRLEGGSGKYDLDDPFITDKAKVDLSFEELRAKLQTVPNPDDYDTWFQIGMALYHQFDGSDDGLMLWHEWSAQAANYDMDVLDEKWPTFDVEGKKREPLTARLILKLAQAEEERVASEELDDVREQITQAGDLAAIRAVCTRIKKIAFEHLTRETLVIPLQAMMKKVAGIQQSPTAIRNLIRYENPEMKAAPVWMDGWVYIQHDETFYSIKTRQALTSRAFDATYNRFMLTRKDRLEGKSVPDTTASSVALNRVEIPTVANRMYLPGEDDIFSLGGVDYVNSYTSNMVPEVPERISKRQQVMIDRIRNHFHHLFSNQRDRKLLLDFLCYVVQTGKRPNWAPIIQGAEGDGKTFLAMLMAVVLGANNVRSVLGESLGEKYTSWAEGVQFLMIEEVRLHGADRYAVINKVKPYITNVMVPIRRMQTDQYEVVNTIAIVMLTNHKDGVPVKEDDTRYYPMFSRWQTKRALDQFNRENPKYYDELHEALSAEYAGAIRKWMLEVRLCKEFNPKKRAPLSSARDELVFLNKTEEEDAFDEALDASAGQLDFCQTMLDSALVQDKLTEHGGAAPYGRQLKMFLSGHGFSYIGVAKDRTNKTRKWWSQEPERFRTEDGKPDGPAIRRWLKGDDI